MGGGASKYTLHTSPSGNDAVPMWLLDPRQSIPQLVHENFQLRAVIGKGKFGIVYVAQEAITSKAVAIKFIPKQIIYDNKCLKRIQQEMDVLNMISHPFIIRVFGYYDSREVVGMVFEYAYGGELYTRMKKVHKMSEDVAKFYFCEIAHALGYLHSLKIIYRDLKPENILLDYAGHIRLCDFGFAMQIGTEETLRDGCGTAMYVAPEIAQGFMKQAHGLPVDWWGLGCVLYEMLYGAPPFGDTDHMSKFEIFNNINGKNVSLPMGASNALKSLIRGLLNKNPNERMNWGEVKRCDWLAEVNWDDLFNKRIEPPWKPKYSESLSTMNFVDWKDTALPKKPVGVEVVEYCSGLSMAHSMSRPSVIMKTNSKLGRESSASKIDNAQDGPRKSIVKKGSDSALTDVGRGSFRGERKKSKTSSPVHDTNSKRPSIQPY